MLWHVNKWWVVYYRVNTLLLDNRFGIDVGKTITNKLFKLRQELFLLLQLIQWSFIPGIWVITVYTHTNTNLYNSKIFIHYRKVLIEVRCPVWLTIMLCHSGQFCKCCMDVRHFPKATACMKRRPLQQHTCITISNSYLFIHAIIFIYTTEWYIPVDVNTSMYIPNNFESKEGWIKR